MHKLNISVSAIQCVNSSIQWYFALFFNNISIIFTIPVHLIIIQIIPLFDLNIISFSILSRKNISLWHYYKCTYKVNLPVRPDANTCKCMTESIHTTHASSHVLISTVFKISMCIKFKSLLFYKRVPYHYLCTPYRIILKYLLL